MMIPIATGSGPTTTTTQAPLSVHLVGGGLPYGAIITAVLGIFVALGAAYFGGRMQRTSSERQMSRQFQITAAADVIASFSAFMDKLARAGAPADPTGGVESFDEMYGSLYSMIGTTSRLKFLGPRELAVKAAALTELGHVASGRAAEMRAEITPDGADLGPIADEVATKNGEALRDFVRTAERVFGTASGARDSMKQGYGGARSGPAAGREVATPS